jgi:hypothetical protein
VEKARQHSALTGPVAAVLAASFPALAALGQPAAVPSGLQVERIEVILDDDLQIGRFRFLAPGIAARGFDPGSLRPDMDALCRDIAVHELRALRPDWDEVVISLSSVAIPFGLSDPEVAQSFEVYRLRGTDCIWSRF